MKTLRQPQTTKGSPAQAVLTSSASAAAIASPVQLAAQQFQQAITDSPRQVAQRQQAASLAPRNNTGLPDHLKAGVEALSGHSLDDVQVHYNSSRPAQFQAHAYAQGSDIHLAPGQEKHLPHEAWHVAQQKQGRVKPTVQLKGVAINHDALLEQEASAMGSRALATPAGKSSSGLIAPIQRRQQAVVQRVAFTSANGTVVDVTPDELVEHLSKWVIRTMKADALTTAPLTKAPSVANHLNWDELHAGGQARDANGMLELYQLVREAKLSPGYNFSLEHGALGLSSYFSSNPMLNSKNRDAHSALDGLAFPPKDLNEVDKGAGVSYKELTTSFQEMAKRKGPNKAERGDAVLAQAHLDLLNKRALPDGAYTNSEIGKMHYHLEVMHLAEGRRNVAMLVFAPMTLQNIADGKISAQRAFGGLVRSRQVKKNGKLQFKNKEEGGEEEEEQVPLMKDKVQSGNFPPAWVGSKSELELTEKHFEEGKSIGSKALGLKDTKKLLKKMRQQVEHFFSTDDHRDFQRGDLQALPGAAFTDKATALQAVEALMRANYFSMIPAFYDVVSDTPGSATARSTQQRQQQRWQAQDTLQDLTGDVSMTTDSVMTMGTLLPEAQRDALGLTTGSDQERLHQRRMQRLAKKVKDKKMDTFSDDESEDELAEAMTSVLDQRQRSKQTRQKQRQEAPAMSEEEAQRQAQAERAKRKRKRETRTQVVGMLEEHDLSDDESHGTLTQKIKAAFEEEQTRKRQKTTSYVAGRELAQNGHALSDAPSMSDTEMQLLSRGFTDGKAALEEQGYNDGLTDNQSAGAAEHVYMKEAFKAGQEDRQKVVERARANRQLHKYNEAPTVEGLLRAQASNDSLSALVRLYYQVLYSPHLSASPSLSTSTEHVEV